MTRVSAFAAGCLTGFSISWNLTNTGAIATELGRHYGVGLAVVGLLTSLAFLAEFVVMIPGGRAIDRFGAKRVALASIALSVAGNALLVVVPGIGAALVLRWLIGFGVGAGFLAGSVWVAALERGRTPLAQGLYGGISLAGAGIATAVVPALEGPLGWRSAYWTGLAVSAAALAVCALGPATPGHGGAHAATPLRQLLAHPLIARLGVVHTASFAFAVIVGNWIVTLLTRNAGLSTSAAGAIGALALVLGVVGRPLGGLAARRRPERIPALLAGSLAAGAAGCALLALTVDPALGVLGAVLVGVASGIPFGPAVGIATSSFPRAPGEAIGAMNLYAVTAIVAGAPLLGLAFSAPGRGRIGFAVLAALALTAVAAVPRFAVRAPAALDAD